MSNSYWIKTTPTKTFSGMDRDLSVDIAVIGAGITGVTTALLLKRAGKKVALIDQFDIATGETGFTTAHLTEVTDIRYHDIISHFGKESAKLVAQSSRQAIELIYQLIKRYDIFCDFLCVPGYLYTENQDDRHFLKKEQEALKAAEVPAHWVDSAPLPFHNYGGIVVQNQAQFHPRKYILALANLIAGNGSFVFTSTRALDIKEDEPCRIITNCGTITADQVVLATNNPITNKLLVQTKIYGYRSYALGAKLSGVPIAAGLYWDTSDPYHYIRFQDDICIIGGEDHKTGHGNENNSFSKLAEYAKKRFSVNSIPFQWSGQIVETADGLPYIGYNPGSEHVLIAAGFRGNGMTFGTFSGILLSDLILKRENKCADLYKANRKVSVSSLKNYMQENIDFPLCFVKDRIKQMPEHILPSEIKNGEARLIQRNTDVLAVYREENGVLHSISAVCTHMGCHVQWNNAEKTWDCPCHASRFSIDGNVLNGPAMKELEQVVLEEKEKSSAA